MDLSNPYIIDRRAASLPDLEQTFHVIDAKRWDWAAERLEQLGSVSGAERAREFAAEHRMTADRLAGAVAIGAGGAA